MDYTISQSVFLFSDGYNDMLRSKALVSILQKCLRTGCGRGRNDSTRTLTQPKYTTGRTLRWVVSGREPILSTFIWIDLGPVRRGKVKEPDVKTHFETKSKKAQELDTDFMTEDSKMV